MAKNRTMAAKNAKARQQAARDAKYHSLGNYSMTALDGRECATRPEYWGTDSVADSRSRRFDPSRRANAKQSMKLDLLAKYGIERKGWQKVGDTWYHDVSRFQEV